MAITKCLISAADGEPLHSDVKAPRASVISRATGIGCAGSKEKIMRNTSGEPRELPDGEVEGVSGGLVVVSIIGILVGPLDAGPPPSVKAPAPEKHWFNGG
jgi:hypothetical protein